MTRIMTWQRLTRWRCHRLRYRTWRWPGLWSGSPGSPSTPCWWKRYMVDPSEYLKREGETPQRTETIFGKHLFDVYLIFGQDLWPILSWNQPPGGSWDLLASLLVCLRSDFHTMKWLRTNWIFRPLSNLQIFVNNVGNLWRMKLMYSRYHFSKRLQCIIVTYVSKASWFSSGLLTWFIIIRTFEEVIEWIRTDTAASIWRCGLCSLLETHTFTSVFLFSHTTTTSFCSTCSPATQTSCECFIFDLKESAHRYAFIRIVGRTDDLGLDCDELISDLHTLKPHTGVSRRRPNVTRLKDNS